MRTVGTDPPLSLSQCCAVHSDYDARISLARRKHEACAKELSNLKNYLRTRNEALLRASRNSDGASSVGGSSLHGDQPVMLRVSRKNLRAIPNPAGTSANAADESSAIVDSLAMRASRSPLRHRRLGNVSPVPEEVSASADGSVASIAAGTNPEAGKIVFATQDEADKAATMNTGTLIAGTGFLCL